MKKLLLLLIVCLLCGCANTNSGPQKPISFFYITRTADYEPGQTLIRQKTVDATDLGASSEDILRAYLQGPVDDPELETPFPAGTELVSTRQSGDVLIVTLSSQFAQLSGIHLSVACACITKTCLPLFDAQIIRIRAYGNTLDGAEYIEMDAESVLLLDIVIPESE